MLSAPSGVTTIAGAKAYAAKLAASPPATAAAAALASPSQHSTAWRDECGGGQACARVSARAHWSAGLATKEVPAGMHSLPHLRARAPASRLHLQQRATAHLCCGGGRAQAQGERRDAARRARSQAVGASETQAALLYDERSANEHAAAQRQQKALLLVEHGGHRHNQRKRPTNVFATAPGHSNAERARCCCSCVLGGALRHVLFLTVGGRAVRASAEWFARGSASRAPGRTCGCAHERARYEWHTTRP